jgi:WW domain
MVNLGFSVLRPNNKGGGGGGGGGGKNVKLDPPALKTPPMSPDDSETSPPQHVLIRNRMVSNDDYDRIIIPNDSLISELTFPQSTDLLPNSPQSQLSSPIIQHQQQDPPGAKVRYSKTELDAALRSFNGVDVVKHDPPASQELNTSSMSQSIVTRVLGIVDIGCVSPFSDRDFTIQTPPRITGPQKVEWGLAPSETIVSLEDNEYPGPAELANKVNVGNIIYPTDIPPATAWPERNDEVIVRITPDENQHEHLQLNFSPESPRRSMPRSEIISNIVPATDNTISDRSSSWNRSKKSATKRKGNKSNRDEAGQPSQKVEAVLGVAPIVGDTIKKPTKSTMKPVSPRGAKGNSYLQEEKKDDADDRKSSSPSKRLFVDPAATQPSFGQKSKNASPLPTRSSSNLKPDATKENNQRPITAKIQVAPVIEPAEYKQTVKIVKPRAVTPTASTKFFGKSGKSTTKNGENPKVIRKLKDRNFLRVFQQKMKKDSDSRTADSSVSDILQPANQERKDRLIENDNRSSSPQQQVRSTLSQELLKDTMEETETRFVPANESSSDNDGTSTPKLRKVLKSIKSSPKALLETVEETAEDDLSCSTNSCSDFRVRIPGILQGAPDAYISDKDLLGDEYIEEEIVTKNRTYINNEAFDEMDEIIRLASSSCESTSDELIGSIDHIESGLPSVTKKITNKNDRTLVVHKSPVSESRDPFFLRRRSLSPTNGVKNKVNNTWQGFLGISSPNILSSVPRDSSQDHGPPDVNDSLTRHNSAPVSCDKATYSTPSSDPTSPTRKAMWKAVVDPNTGRSYYYHRQTRETTWTKPPEEDIIPLKVKNSSTLTEREHSSQNIVAVSNSNIVDLSLDISTPHDKVHWEKKEEVSKIMSQMNDPPSSENLERIVKQYNGREDEFIAKLRDLSDSKPFDEPIPSNANSFVSADDNTTGEDGVTQGQPCAEGSIAFSRTLASIHSGFSGNFSSSTRISDQTQPIRNTASGRPGFATIQENTKNSSESQTFIRRRYPIQNNAPIPKNIPVPRTRELTVEEFTTRDPVFGVKESDIQERKARGLHRQRNSNPTEPKTNSNTISSYFSFEPSAYLGDVEEYTETDKDTASYGQTTDSVSALSEADLSFVTLQENLEITRRRALYDALAKKDFDRAAEISETMRMERHSQVHASKSIRQTGDEQSGPLDQYISENDFDAVVTYIDQVRAQETHRQNGNKSKSSNKKYNEYDTKQDRTPMNLSSGSNRGYSSPAIRAATPTPTHMFHLNNQSNQGMSTRSRFGASSQLQHLKDTENSYSSYSSYSSYTSENSSGSYFTEEEEQPIRISNSRGSAKEFSC